MTLESNASDTDLGMLWNHFIICNILVGKSAIFLGMKKGILIRGD